MKRSTFHKVNLLLLTAALVFGQVGAGFFHNKHDAHERITDLDHTVLVPHGEHCKICSVDWVHQFLAPAVDVPSADQHHFIAEAGFVYSILEVSQSLTRDRAPPVMA